MKRKYILKKSKFQDLLQRENIYLYAGDLRLDRSPHPPFVGLSLESHDEHHITHDITSPMELPNNCVDIYQAQDVMEHIEYKRLPSAINEIHRVLKPDGVFRLSLPDYRCDILYKRSLKDSNGEIFFDQGGGGSYDYSRKKVIEGGHQWFPTYELTKSLLEETEFTDLNFLHYYDTDGTAVLKDIDHSIGKVVRTPDHDPRVQNPRRPMSIVVDCRK